MEGFTGILLILLTSILVNNFVLSRFLGICPFLGVSKRVETALGMGMAVTFVMALASVISYLVHYYILVPMHIEYMQTIAFILVIAALVQLVEMALQKAGAVAVQRARRLSAAHYHQLRSAGCCDHQYHRTVHAAADADERYRCSHRLYVGDRAVCRYTRTA